MSVTQAEELAISGIHDDALRLLEPILTDGTHGDFAAAIRVAAAIHAHRGMLGRSAALYTLLEGSPFTEDAAAAAVAQIGVGDLERATELLDEGRPQVSSAAATAWRLTADGLHQTLLGDGTTGLATLIQAMTAMTPVGRNTVLLDSPGAIAATVALHLGELDLAESILGQATASDIGGETLLPRHGVLRAWVSMAQGNMTEASARLDEVGALPFGDLRDIYLAQAIRVGIARRTSDSEALADAWAKARIAVAGMSIDLFHLLPLGELLVAAAHMGDLHWLASQVAEADELLARLGQPALWSAAYHWYGVQAAIVAEQPNDLLPHAEAITAAAKSSRHAGTLAEAGRTWIRVLGREVDPVEIGKAVNGLTRVGLAWDASRLAAQAALHSTDRRVTLDLLNMARAAHGSHSTSSTTKEANSRSNRLTDREWEIARLVVRGIRYREIGERLYISPKTVEHHVASIRRRLGSNSRADMIDTLRRLLASSDALE